MSSENEFSFIPEGYHSVTPSLTLKDPALAMEFYAKAFGAVELFRLDDEKNQKIMHAEMKIGNSILMLSSEYPEWGSVAPETGKGMSFMIYVENCDEALKQAESAGAAVLMPPADMFWGDRMGQVACPHGYRWSLAQKVRDVPPEEIMAAAKAWSENPEACSAGGD